MMKNTAIKVLTLILFITLMIAFVYYRSSIVSNTSNASAEKTEENTDTVKITEIMSSSKSVIAIDGIKIDYDSLLDKALTEHSTMKMDTLISSSKYGLVIDPEDLKFILDSIANDTIPKK